MKKIMIPSLILMVCVTVGSGCQYLKSAAPVPSEQADAKPATTIKTGKLTLNTETLGTLEDPKPLTAKLEKIFLQREAEGILRKGTNVVVKDVYVVADPKISIGKLAALMQNGGEFWLPRGKSISDSGKLVKPNPLTLVLKTENAPTDWMPAFGFADDDLANLACLVNFTTVETKEDLLLARATANSLEIASDDGLFLNTELKQEQLKANDPKPDQRPVTDSELSAVLGKLYDSRYADVIYSRQSATLKLFVSENASYASLLKVLAAIDKPYVTVDVRIRPMRFPEKKKE
ncbi:MAG: hypothetical protein IPK98_00235 [Chloracidobacterium sp.]|nr:hypothetical protein [Chloracidobacterium sp.]